MPRLLIICSLVLAGLWLVADDFNVIPGAAEERLLLAEINREEGVAFRQRNTVEEGFVTLPSGMQVKILEYGGGRIPDPEDWVQVHYQGWHIDGRLFDSSHRLGLPGTMPIQRTIAGWQQVLASIPEGTRARIVLPPELAYGLAGSGFIGPDETLIFEIELLGIIERPENRKLQRMDPLQQPVPGLG